MTETRNQDVQVTIGGCAGLRVAVNSAAYANTRGLQMEQPIMISRQVVDPQGYPTLESSNVPSIRFHFVAGKIAGLPTADDNLRSERGQALARAHLAFRTTNFVLRRDMERHGTEVPMYSIHIGWPHDRHLPVEPSDFGELYSRIVDQLDDYTDGIPRCERAKHDKPEPKTALEFVQGELHALAFARQWGRIDPETKGLIERLWWDAEKLVRGARKHTTSPVDEVLMQG